MIEFLQQALLWPDARNPYGCAPVCRWFGKSDIVTFFLSNETVDGGILASLFILTTPCLYGRAYAQHVDVPGEKTHDARTVCDVALDPRCWVVYLHAADKSSRLTC